MKKSAKDRALSILERKDATEYQMKDALKRAAYDDQEIVETVEWLKELGYINDIDYAHRYLELLAAKGRGRIRIRQEMRKRGLSGPEIENIIEDGFSEEQEKENALVIARKYLETLPQDIDENVVKRRLSSKLVTQGYSFDIVNGIMDSVLKS